MKRIFNFLLLTAVFLITAGWNTHFISDVVTESSRVADQGERIALISSKFLGTPYQAGTMKGSPDEQEELIIRLDGMDCFTFLDYVEAIRLSGTADEFPIKLRNVRYFDGEVDYKHRKHFFTDWISGEHNTVKDITPELPGAIMVEKYINRRSDEKSWLKNLPQTMRMVTYLPSKMVNKDVIKMLNTGDYIGVYTAKEGLDVTHTGIFIKNSDGEFFRNTSSLAHKVTDYKFKDYLKDIEGIIVFRPI